jgi:hypothetical protein
MPLAPSDVFVCKIDDGAPRIANRDSRHEPAGPPLGVWLVYSSCFHCHNRGRYCDRHDTLWIWR